MHGIEKLLKTLFSENSLKNYDLSFTKQFGNDFQKSVI
jgi:hypothetical protein